MKNLRFYLLLGLSFLVGLILTGCLGQTRGPQALFTVSPAQHLIPFTAEFDGTLSYVSEGEIVTYEWDFGDGAQASGPQVEHEFTESGDYVVELTVTDDRGHSSTSSLTVHALNPLPSPSFTYYPKSLLNGEYVVGAGEQITFDASDSIDDGVIVSYQWDFGNGETATTSEETVTHRYLWPSDRSQYAQDGRYVITLTVIDDDGGQASCEDTVRVIGGPPCPGNTS